MTYAQQIVDENDARILHTREISADEVISVLAGNGEGGGVQAKSATGKGTMKKVVKITKRNGTVATVAPAGSHKKGQKVCRICGVPGHMAKTCPKGNSRGQKSAEARREEQAESSLSDEVKDRIKDMRDHDMTTSEIAAQLARELDMDEESLKKEVEKVLSRGADRHTSTVTGAIGREQYDAIRTAMHDRDFSSASYSLTRKVPAREVNTAVSSTDYKNYLKIRSV